MLKFIIRRVLAMIPTILLVIFIVFFITNIIPGDPGRTILGIKGSAKEVALINEELGIDDPLLIKYVNYLKGVIVGDFGTSYISRVSVLDEISKKFPETFKLAVIATVVTAIFAIPIGIISATKQHSLLDATIVISSLGLASIPGFWLAIVLIMIFSLNLGWLPTSGIGSIKHYILPIATLSLPAIGFLSRMVRATMLEVLLQDYIRTAKAKGATRRQIIFKHALKNVLIPAVTILGFGFSGMLSGAIITEMIFGLPGIGQIVLNAVRMNNVPVVLGSTILLSVSFMLVILAMDIIYMLIDPRIRKQYI